jgi:hypothetical protein
LYPWKKIALFAVELMMVNPVPAPRKVTPVFIFKLVLHVYVPADKYTTPLLGQLLMADCTVATDAPAEIVA